MPQWASMRDWYNHLRGEFIHHCTSCGICVDVCPLFGLADWDGRSSVAFQEERLAVLRGDPLQTNPSDVRWITKVEENPPVAETVLFLGCDIMGMPDRVHTLLDILDLLGLNVPVVAGPQLCCGGVQLRQGDLTAVERLLSNLVGSLARFHPKTVVYWCNGCLGNLTLIASQFVDVPFRNQHIAAFLCEYLDHHPFQRLVKRVTVHDPCAARVVGEYEPVRRLLGAIPGLELVEMANNRDDAYCCNGAIRSTSVDGVPLMTDLVVCQARKTGASTLATICSGCQARFGGRDKDYPFVVESFVTLVGEALGIRYEDRLKRLLQYHDPQRVIAECGEQIAASDYEPAELESLVRKYFK